MHEDVRKGIAFFFNVQRYTNCYMYFNTYLAWCIRITDRVDLLKHMSLPNNINITFCILLQYRLCRYYCKRKGVSLVRVI